MSKSSEGVKRNQPGFKSFEAEKKFTEIYHTFLEDWPTTTSHSIKTSYGDSHVWSCGEDALPPLLLLHGRYTPSVIWTPMIKELSKHHKIYALDTIGEPGMSISNGEPIRSAEDYTDWLKATVDGLDLDCFHVVAHSFSGWFATHFSLRFPERAKTLTLLDPAQVFAQFSLRWIAHCIPPYLFPSEKTVHPFFRWMAQGHKVDASLLELLTIGMTSY